MNNINIYCIDDYEWIAASSEEEAKKFYFEFVDENPQHGIELILLSEEELKRHKYENLHSFKVELNNRINEGQAFPQYFACADY